MRPADVTHAGVVTLWAHGRGHVRLEDGREVTCTPGSKVRGQVTPDTRVSVVLSEDGAIGRIVARLDDVPPERLKASERRRRQVQQGGEG